MFLKVFFLILLFCFFSIIQNSFLFYFNILGALPNLVFILFFIIVFFDDFTKYRKGILWAIFAGFLLDISSVSFLGTSIAAFLLINFFIKKILQNLREIDHKYLLFYLVPLFVCSIVFYKLFFIFSFYLTNRIFLPFLNAAFIIELLYNLFFAVIFFYLVNFINGYKKI